jgi:hypothetical protein
MILEGILTTVNADDSTNVAPMGPHVDESISQFVLRPFKSSLTYQNLIHHPECVWHVTDNVELLARAAIGCWEEPPEMFDAPGIRGKILADACRWYALRVIGIDDRDERASMECKVVGWGRIRDFLGFNRAKHATVEAAILATRVRMLDAAWILAEYERLRVIVDKTAGNQERRAFGLLDDYVRHELAHPTRGNHHRRT